MDNKQKYIKSTFSIREDLKQKLNIISGLNNTTINDIVNHLLESNQNIDEMLEESKKNSKFI